jgi:polyisoprenoid-binding protein YceI
MAWAVQAAPETFKADAAHSSVGFKIRHLGISWVKGTFKDFEGTAIFDAEKPEMSSVQVTVQAASVDTGNKDRDAHLQKDEFFNVEKFPTLSFKSTKVVKKDGDVYEVTGDFTLMGVTKPVTFTFEASGPIKGMKGETRRGGETEFKIKRSDFGMAKMIGPIGDEVQISLAFEGVLQ